MVDCRNCIACFDNGGDCVYEDIMAKESQLKSMGFAKKQRVVSDTYRKNLEKINWKTPEDFEVERVESGARIKTVYKFKK